MALATRYRVGYLLVVCNFPLYGVFGYLRAENWSLLGYLIYVVPMSVYVAWVLIVEMLGARPRISDYLLHKENRLHVLLMIVFFLVMLLGLLYAGAVGGRDWLYSIAEAVLLAVMIFFWVYILNSARMLPDGLPRIYNAVFVSLFIYLGANIGAILLGLDSEGQLARYTREFGALLSPVGVRTIFPWTHGGQYFAIVGGVVVLMSILKFRGHSYGNWVLGVIGLTLGIVVLLAQSARAPVLALVLVLAYGLIWRRVGRMVSPVLILALAVLPVTFVYFDIGIQLNDFLDWIGLDISRSEGDVASLSNRDVIWSAALHHMIYEAGLIHNVLGYGSYGHISSEVSASYQWLFEHSYEGLEYPPLHSGYVQTYVDFGSMGVILLMSILLVGAQRIRTMTLRDRCLRTEATGLMMILTYLSVCNVTEITIGYYAWDLLALFLFINFYVMARRVLLSSENQPKLLRRV